MLKANDGKERTVEERYQKKTQHEHILLRPDSYVGSIEQTNTNFWVQHENAKKFIQKDIVYTPALYKIFDEIIVNAADNFQRDDTMDSIKVEINEETGTISVWNNGKGTNF